MCDPLKSVLEESGVEIEKGDFSRITRMLNQKDRAEHELDYVQKVCLGKIPNENVFTFCLEYFKEKGRMYRQLEYWLSTWPEKHVCIHCSCAQED